MNVLPETMDMIQAAATAIGVVLVAMIAINGVAHLVARGLFGGDD